MFVVRHATDDAVIARPHVRDVGVTFKERSVADLAREATDSACFAGWCRRVRMFASWLRTGRDGATLGEVSQSEDASSRRVYPGLRGADFESGE